jgi:hypothetical protein
MKSLFEHRARLSILVLTASLLLGAVGCSSKGRSDAEIIGDVVTRIHANPQISNKNVAVMASKGVVTLNGSEPNENERIAVQNTAAQAEGVKTIINDIMLDGPVATPTTAEVQPVESPAPKVAEAAPAQERQRKPSAYHEKQAKNTSPEPRDTVRQTNTATSSTSTSTVASNPANPLPVTGSTGTPLSAVVPPTPAPTPIQLVAVPSGTPLSVRLTEPVDSGQNQPGDVFHATLDAPVYVGDQTVIPEGASVVGRVTEVHDSGRFSGRPELALELSSIQVNNRRYVIQTNQYTKQGGSQGSRTAKSVGGGAAVGALIGAIAGGGKGAAIGAAVGAGAGGGVQAARKPQQVHLASEARLSFRLANTISVAPVGTIDRGSSNRVASNNDGYDPYSDAHTSSSQSQGPAKVYDDDQDDPNRPVLKRRTPQSNPPNNN